MLAVRCSAVDTASGLVLLPETRIVRMADDGAGTIVVEARCWSGHLHRITTGRAVTDRAAERAALPAPVPALAS